MKLSKSKKYYDKRGEVKIICFVNKHYLVAKEKHQTPFLIMICEFEKQFKEVGNA